ncbi:MAG: tellurite resistance TerB family protein [Thermoplasmatota archaeon]
MSLFRKDKTVAADDETLTPQEALAGVAVAMMYADGVLDESESIAISENLGRLPVFQDVDGDGLQDIFRKLYRIAAKEGDAALLSRCSAAVPERLRGTAYFIAADVAHADGEMAPTEAALLERTREKLGLDATVAANIREVVAVKNRA